MQILYFAWVRERIGLPREQVDTEDVAVKHGITTHRTSRVSALSSLDLPESHVSLYALPSLSHMALATATSNGWDSITLSGRPAFGNIISSNPPECSMSDAESDPRDPASRIGAW